MRYLPHTPEDIAHMLKAIGVEGLERLFSMVPADCRRTEPLDLPPPLTEWDLNHHMAGLAKTMASSPEVRVFLGAGSYEHHIPAILPYLLSRSEFATSYTPYQPEMSQGTLQAIYEYQTLVARLLGMEVANASLYDGASALAEGLLMAMRITGRKRIVLSSLIHPSYRQVVRTYLAPTEAEIIELPYLSSGTTDLEALGALGPMAAVAIQSPNFLGCIEDLEAFSTQTHQQAGQFVGCFTEPLAYGILKSPGTQGADIVCGEGQSLGNPMSFGGPGLGLFATRSLHVRSMPGRLVGKTTDEEGKRGFVLTLATREQHIRREKATSNICTNNNLCALASLIYMACLGKSGFRSLAQLNHDKAEYLKRGLRQKGMKIPFEAPTFNEFVVEFNGNGEEKHKELMEKGIVAGMALQACYPGLAHHYLLCVTETKTREDLDALTEAIG